MPDTKVKTTIIIIPVPKKWVKAILNWSCSLYNELFEKNFRSLCQKYDLAVIEYAPKDEVLSLASEADILPLTGKAINIENSSKTFVK